MKAKTLVGKLDAAFRVAKWMGTDYPTIIYRHGNKEAPFVFKKYAKTAFTRFLQNKFLPF